MNLEGANETDIREEIAAPLLAALGYARGTENDILRELNLKYGKSFLGRKKDNDPPIRGRADYVLAVAGAGRWVLEIKAPNEEITQDAIEQTISYARHPEVSATYAAILNGRRFQLFHCTQTSDDQPQMDIEIQSVDQLTLALRGILSPSDIRRDCSPPTVDLARPLAEGFRSTARIVGGFVTYDEFEWDCNFPIGLGADQLEKACQVIKGLRSAITGGSVSRDENSRIKARLNWAYPHDEMIQFALDKQIMEFEYVSLDEEISTDPDSPTTFDVVGDLVVQQGETLFDILRWESTMAGIDTSMNLRGMAVGHIEGINFVGTFQSEYESRFPKLPGMVLSMYGSGNFSVELDPR